MPRFFDYSLDAWGTQLVERVQEDTKPWRDDLEYYSRLVALRGTIECSENIRPDIEDYLLQQSFGRERVRRAELARRG